MWTLTHPGTIICIKSTSVAMAVNFKSLHYSDLILLHTLQSAEEIQMNAYWPQQSDRGSKLQPDTGQVNLWQVATTPDADLSLTGRQRRLKQNNLKTLTFLVVEPSIAGGRRCAGSVAAGLQVFNSLLERITSPHIVSLFSVPQACPPPACCCWGVILWFRGLVGAPRSCQ